MTSARLNRVLALGLFAASMLALCVGRHWIAPSSWLADDLASIIIVDLRLPRIVSGMLVGGALGLAGAVMQGYLRNPLADHGLFGISACAALGAVISLFFGLAVGIWILPAFAMAGAMAGAALLVLLAGRTGSTMFFTLAGVLLSSLASAFTALMINLSPTPFATAEIVTWLMGALTNRSWNDVLIGAPLVGAGAIMLMMTARSLDALTLGDMAARSMGVDMRRLQWLIVGGLGLTGGASVAIAGIIGFVGLMVPHLVRSLTDHRTSSLLLPSALSGALLVVLSDTAIRTAPVASELRLGIMMSVLGGPFFFYLLLKMRRELA